MTAKLGLRGLLLVTLFVFLSFNPQNGSSEKILFFFSISTYSHRIPVWPLIERLVDAGHSITFMSPYPPKEPNPKVTEFTPVAVKEFLDAAEELNDGLKFRRDGLVEWGWFEMPLWGLAACEAFLNSPETPEWVKKSSFDLVVIDGLFNDCGLGLAHKFKAPHMIFDTSALFVWQNDAFGMPAENSWIPDMAYHYPQQMSFFQRVATTGLMLYQHFAREYFYLPKLTEMLKVHLDSPDMPPLREIEKNASLVLMNSHFSEEFARSLPPLVIPIGGMHIKDNNKPLPKQFEDFIAKGGDAGFIYVSFGSAVQISKAPPQLQSAFFDALGRLKLQVIWKWEGEFPKDAPSNVFMSKWMPQQDILAHPKIRGFVTHSGLMSIQEAIWHGVPLVSLPVFAEQDYNAERVHRGEYGVRLEITTITADQLFDAISKIVYEPKYKSNMARMSKTFKDRPMKPVDTAVWWTEYVLRHGGETSSLRPLAIHQNWFQRRLLDVWSFIFGVLLLAVFLIIKILRVVVSIICGSSKSTKRKQKTN